MADPVLYTQAVRIKLGEAYAAAAPTHETPVGLVDGFNADFVLAHLPLAGTEKVTRNGLLQEPGYDYTLAGSTITFTAPPLVGSRILVTYYRAD